MSEQVEEICVQRFLSWYNEQQKGNYIQQRAEDYFSELKGGLRWEFVVYERANPQEWIGIEVKELPRLIEVHKQFEFWHKLCLELTQDLAGKGIHGEFVIYPSIFNLKSNERRKFREAFIEVLCQKAPSMKVDEEIDISPDIADKFTSWPLEKCSNFDEYDKWGANRPCKLKVMKSTDAGCEVKAPISLFVGGDVIEAHKEAFNQVFKPKGIQANKQLKLAREKGARKTILLLACNPFVDEGLIKSHLQSLDRRLVSEIDYIYFVDIGNKDRVSKIYPIDRG